jgi:signal transduction histidine kinase/BarA-like signal transduction histidine kinase
VGRPCPATDANAEAAREEIVGRDLRADAFARLFEAVHEGVFIGVVDATAGGTAARPRRAEQTIAANPHLRQIFGYPPDTADEQVAPFAPDRFSDPEARTAFFERLAADGAVTDHLIRMRRIDGAPVWVEVTARTSPPRTARGSRSQANGLLHIEALVRDVSGRKKLDDQARDLYQQLLQAEKMAALGQTISGVAHELNNPLATILSWAERLNEKPLDDTAKRGVDIIFSEAERAARIVRNLLTFARKRQSTRTMIDLNAVVQETLELRVYEPDHQPIHLVTALASGLPQVFADGHQIQQVLLNLLTNAEQALGATSEAGSIVVRTWHAAEQTPDHGAGSDADRSTDQSADRSADHDAVCLEVNDNGPGIPPEMKTRIFDPFFTTKEVGKGTGLGLTVAYAIAQEHGGRIRVDSPVLPADDRHPAHGTSFVLELPVSGQATPRPQRPLAPPTDAVRGATVLLVEDEKALATAVSDALRDAGLKVDHAGDGQEALARIRSTTYDAIICDLKMPRVDGMTLYRAIAAATPALARRVIFVTGDVAGTDAERFLEDSGCAWLAKPFRLGELLRVVRETLA